MGPVFTQEYGDKDARLRVIFDNGTESNLLRRSLQRALHKDPAGRRITEPTAGPLFVRSRRQTATRRAARSTSFGASPIFLESQNIAN